MKLIAESRGQQRGKGGTVLITHCTFPQLFDSLNEHGAFVVAQARLANGDVFKLQRAAFNLTAPAGTIG